MALMELLDAIDPLLPIELRIVAGLRKPALPGGRGGKAQSGGGAGGGPFANVGMLLLLASVFGLDCSSIRCNEGDMMDIGGDPGPL
jgi:hypothetical protein